MFNCPILVWFLSIFQPPKRYRVVEDEDGLGYWLEEIKDDDAG
jgi:hypothetical protein